MTKALSVKSIVVQQQKLQEEYNKASVAAQKARVTLVEKKSELVSFNNKYGRVIKLMNED